jgi:hypothetical protein
MRISSVSAARAYALESTTPSRRPGALRPQGVRVTLSAANDG